MARLIRLVLVTALLAAAMPARADPVRRWRPEIAAASARFGIPADWIERVMRAESGGRTHRHGRPIRSPAGAIGLMQLMPGTWRELRARLRLGRDPDDPRDNIMAGAFYLAQLHGRFGYPGLFGAYHAGPARYARHLAGAPLPDATRAYLATVVPDHARTPGLAGTRRGPSRRPSSGDPDPDRRGGAIFFPLTGTAGDPGGRR